MKILKPAEPAVVRLCGRAPIQSEKTYRRFRYLLVRDGEDGHRILNTLTSEVICLEDDEYARFMSLSSAYAPWMDALIEKRFLVEADTDDKQYVQLLRCLARAFIRPALEKNYMILPTSACNARCYYCYESGEEPAFMTDETADETVRFITAQHKSGPVRITWFGGEPLLGERIIDRIVEGLCKAGLEVSSCMVSNGYLFTRALIQKAVGSWHLERIQITLDGTQEVYDRVKDYRGAARRSPFLTVMDNIDALLENGVAVTVRLNVGRDNADDLFRLTEQLAARFAGRERFRLYARMLSEECGYRPLKLAPGEKARLRESCDALCERIGKTFGSRTEPDIPEAASAYCMADSRNYLLINPRGELALCDREISAHIIGTVTRGITVPEEKSYMTGYFEYEQCAECPLYPVCLLPTFCPVFEREERCRSRDRKISDILRTLAQLSGAEH